MAEGETINVVGGITVDDYTAELINRMAKKFYSDPENVRKFEEWHLKEYGCPPNGGKNNF